jgi:hypothetical protein
MTRRRSGVTLVERLLNRAGREVGKVIGKLELEEHKKKARDHRGAQETEGIAERLPKGYQVRTTTARSRGGYAPTWR